MKNKIVIIAVTAIIIFGTALFLKGQFSSRNENITESDINSAKESFSKMIAQSNPKDFGLESADQLKSLRVGYQFTRNMIALDDIRKYKEETDPASIIKSVDIVDVILVNDAGAIVTSIEFTKDKDHYVASGFGFTPSTTSLKNAAGIIGPEKLKNGRFVDIPSLHLSFVAVSDSTLNFISVQDDANANLRTGMEAPANKVLGSLVSIANAYNGLPQ